MAEIEEKILKALNTKLSELVLDPVLPIAWEGKEFTPPLNHRYLRPHDLPLPTVPYSIATSDEYAGIYQVDVFWDRDKSLMSPNSVVGQVTRHFRARTLIFPDGLGPLTITRSQRAPMVEEGAAIFIPVSIYYRSFVPS